MDNSTRYIKRHLSAPITQALSDTPVICLLGPRQCGKSTLAAKMAQNRLYISLDDSTYYNLAKDQPQGFIDQLPPYVTIDEIQRVPELMIAIKRSVDNNRQAGRFLLTGSANLLQLPRLADSLAGRMECIYLHPITEAEKNGQLGHFIKDLIRGAIEPSIIAVNEVGLQSTLPKRLVAGGYPEAFQRLPERAIQWQSQYIQSIIERDIKDIAQVKEGADIKRLLEYVAQQTAQLINVNETAKALGHTRATIDKHLGILEKVFLIRRIKAWHRNTSKRLVKAPKIHICDSGLAAALMGLTQDQWLEQHKQFGFLLESFIVQQLIAQAGWTDPMLRFYHYRDKDQVEVDCVIEKGKKIWGIEIKMSKSIHSKDGQGLRRLHRQAGDDFQQGIIFYDGDSTLQMSKSPNILAVPINELWKR